MRLFKKKVAAVPNRATSPARKPTPEFMEKKPVNTPETRHAEAMHQWRTNNNKAQMKQFGSDAQAKGIEQSMSERKKYKAKGPTVTAEGGRAIDTGRM